MRKVLLWCALFTFVGSPAASAATITFEQGFTEVGSFSTEGLVDLASIGTWDGAPVSPDNMPTDQQRLLSSTINLFFPHADPSRLFVQVTDVVTTRGAWWSGQAFNNVTQTGVRITIPGFSGQPTLVSDWANPNQIRAFGVPGNESTEPLINTPGYVLRVVMDTQFLISAVGGQNGFTSLGGIYGASRIRGGGVFELVFSPDTNLSLLDPSSLTVEASYGLGNQFIAGELAAIPEPSTALLLGLGLVGMAARRRPRR